MIRARVKKFLHYLAKIPIRIIILVFLCYITVSHFILFSQKEYKIFLIEQQDVNPFNNGVLYNAGARIAMEEGFPCLIFHNIDLLPLDNSNLYACMNQPRHMSAAVDVFRFILDHEDRIGGALAIKAKQYKLVNGFSNSFDIGSGRDAEFRRRIAANGLELQRFPPEMSRYHMLRHKPMSSIAVQRKILFYTRTKDDGLNNVDIHVEKITVEAKSLYILIGVKLRFDNQLDVTGPKSNSYITRDMVICMSWTPAMFVLAKATFIWLRGGEVL